MNHKESILKIAAVLSDRFSHDDKLAAALAELPRRKTEFMALARESGLLPQIGKAVSSRNLSKAIPADLASEAMKASREAAAFNILLYDTGQRIIDTAKNEGIDIVPLKGLSFLDRLYDFDERGMKDIDFLVRSGQIGQLGPVMDNLDFRPAPSDLPEDFAIEYSGEIKFRASRAGATLDAEFHWDVSPGPAMQKTFPLPCETLWEMTEIHEGRLHLSPEAELLSCIHHLAARHSFSRLKWFLDIHRLTTSCRSEIDWQSLAGRFRDAGLSRAACAIFHFNHDFFGTPVPAPVEDLRPGRLKAAFIRTLIIESLTGSPLRKTGALSAMAADRKFSYFFYTLFPGKDFLKRRYPGVPAPFLGGHRLADMIRKAIN